MLNMLNNMMNFDIDYENAIQDICNFHLQVAERLGKEIEKIKIHKTKLVAAQKYEEAARLRDIERKLFFALEQSNAYIEFIKSVK